MNKKQKELYTLLSVLPKYKHVMFGEHAEETQHVEEKEAISKKIKEFYDTGKLEDIVSVIVEIEEGGSITTSSLRNYAAEAKGYQITKDGKFYNAANQLRNEIPLVPGHQDMSESHYKLSI